MDAARYYIALLALIVYPPMVLFWIIIHPLTVLWRRIGPAFTYGCTLVIMAAVAFLIYQVKDTILAHDFGINWILIAFAACFMVSGIALECWCRRHLSIGTLVGMPQLSSEGQPGQLLTEGPYSRMRHPRYGGALLGVVAVALFVNYLGIYVMAALLFPGLYLVTILEEKELSLRFGEPYRKYQRQVPRFIPKWRVTADDRQNQV